MCSNPGRTNFGRVGCGSHLNRRRKSFPAMLKNNWFDLFPRLRNPLVEFDSRYLNIMMRFTHPGPFFAIPKSTGRRVAKWRLKVEIATKSNLRALREGLKGGLRVINSQCWCPHRFEVFCGPQRLAGVCLDADMPHGSLFGPEMKTTRPCTRAQNELSPCHFAILPLYYMLLLVKFIKNNSHQSCVIINTFS